MIKIRTRKGSLFSEQSTIHKFLRARVMATYKNFNLIKMKTRDHIVDEDKVMNYAPQYKYQRDDCYRTLEQKYLYDSSHGVNSGQHATEKDRRWNPQRICTIAPINQNLDSDCYPDKCLIFHIIKFESFAFIERPKRHKLMELQ